MQLRLILFGGKTNVCSFFPRVITFIQLKSRLINIMMNALQVETDAQNTHMLLGGLMLCVQDSAIFEETSDINTDYPHTSPAPSDTNLLSSGIHRVISFVPTFQSNSAEPGRCILFFSFQFSYRFRV